MKLLAIWTLSATIIMSHGVTLNTMYEWKFVDFTWESSMARNEAITSGIYDPEEVVLYDVDKARDGRFFVTSVRDKGVPASVMMITNETGEGGPLLRPYPDWSWYKTSNCWEDHIISVYRVYIECNHLFVLDCGKFGDDAVCPPQLLIFDLKNDILVKKVDIPYKYAPANGSLLVTPIVDSKDCRKILKATVFMADTEGSGLVIWNGENSKICRVESNDMKPTNSNFTVEGQSFSLNDGILGMTYTDKELYYAPLAGNAIYEMEGCKLKYCPNSNQANNLTQLVTPLSGQTGPMASRHCALFFSDIPSTSIKCADVGKKVNANNTDTIVTDPERLQFPSGMKAKVEDNELLIMSNRYQKVASGTLNINETNFRILSMSLEQIRNETNCFDSCSDNCWGRHKHFNHWLDNCRGRHKHLNHWLDNFWGSHKHHKYC